MIRFRCQKCGKKLKAEEEIVGRKVRCTRCESIEVVPESDNLVKPMARKSRLPTSKPDVPIRSPKSRGMDANTINLDQPVELFDPSTSGRLLEGDFEPHFNVVQSRGAHSKLRRALLIGLTSVFAVAVVAVVFNLNWLLDVRKRFSTDYQNLPEVVYYRNQLTKLEKSRRMMYVAGRNSLAAQLGSSEEINKLEEYNHSVQAMTQNEALIKEVESLFRKGEDKKARALLVSTAKTMIEMREEVELRTKEFLNNVN